MIVFGDKDMFCVRDRKTGQVVASGFPNKSMAKGWRDEANLQLHIDAVKNKKPCIPVLCVSRAAHHWRGPSGVIPK